VFPNASDNSGQKFAEIDWITRAKQSFGDPSRIDVLVAHYSNGGEGRRAWEGPATLTCDSWLFDRPQALAHEVGHIIGLEHPMQPEQTAVRDPELQADNGTAEPWKYWDLFYGLGPAPNYTPKVYFSSRESARSFAADGGTLYTKATWNDGHNCTVDNHCTLTCNIGQFNGKGAAEQVTLGDEGAKGLAFTFVGDNPPSSYQRGVNTMLYVDDPLNSCQRTSFSDSQAEQVKKILRSDILAQAGWLGYDLSMKIPTRRYALGNIRSVSGFEQVDFDKDGKRDIAVWEPPETAGGTGTFRVLTSSSGYTTELTRRFGLSGDVPVPADYDGDGFADFAVIRRGLMNASDPYDSGIYWVWCSSQHNQDCGTDNWGYGYDQWGYQQDVPLPGLEFDGNPNTKEVAVYRPSNGIIYWKVVGSATWWTIYTRFQFNPNFAHLNGLYDSDNKTDLASYDEQNGRFYILLSTRNWDINQVIVRDVNSALAPNAVLAYDAGASAPAIRFGGVPVVAEKSGRRVLRVWDAYTATWYTNWSPITSSTFQACSFGAHGDVPLAGPIDSDLDGRTDLALYRATGNFTPLIYVQRTNEATCSLGTALAWPGGPRRNVVAALRDLAGSVDGRGDFLVLDPDASRWTRVLSQANGTFSVQPTIDFGHVWAMAL